MLTRRKLVCTFRVATPDVSEVKVYRLTTPAAAQASVELRFPFLGDGKPVHVAPVLSAHTEGRR